MRVFGPRFPGRNKWQNGFLGRDGAVSGRWVVGALRDGSFRSVRLAFDSVLGTVGGVVGIFGELCAPCRRVLFLSEECRYGLPCDAPCVLRILPREDTANTFGGPWAGFEKWEGAPSVGLSWAHREVYRCAD